MASWLPLIVLLLTPLATPAAEEGNPDIGERIYRYGMLANGEPLEAVTQGDIHFTGEQMSCASCHRRSGYGSSEGGNYVLPITGPYLFTKRDADRAQLFKKLFLEKQPGRFNARVRSPQTRPAYDEDSLAVALRDGIDPTGRELDPLMPRYPLDDENMAHLTAYLKTLAVSNDPGVDDDTIYLATIVAEGSDPAEADAMLRTMRLFVSWMNKDTTGDMSRPAFSPHYRAQFLDAYRLWQLDVWELKGPRETWPDQLYDYYQKQPVFAVISGIAPGPWAPMHQFCDSMALPCLFPHTDLPETGADDSYTVYFNRGLTLEGEAAAKHLEEQPNFGAPLKVVQIHQETAAGTRPAAAVFETLGAKGNVALSERSFGSTEELAEQLQEVLDQATQPDYLLLWPGDQAEAALNWLVENGVPANKVLLPSKATHLVPKILPDALNEALVFTYPYEVPSAIHPRAYRVRAWMHTRRLDISHRDLQYDTYYALTIMQFGLMHIVEAFSRDYFMEYVEHEAENSLNPGTYPRLALGPGQRYASKGAYIVSWDDEENQVEAVTDWIIP